MIRYYTYYSCGGYKDLYIGSDADQVDASYFIPLLNVWKKSDKPGMTEKVAKAESVQNVKLITSTYNYGFPSECNLMFSHGGYNAIYRTLKDGRTCLCIRDISNNSKDEEGRDIPFNFFFLADDKESINKLDILALDYITNGSQIKGLIADSISYDPIVNGVKFNLSKLNKLFVLNSDAPVYKLEHKEDTVEFMIIGSREHYTTALSEQRIKESNVNAMIDSAGIFYGSIAYHKDTSTNVANRVAIDDGISDAENTGDAVEDITENVSSISMHEAEEFSMTKEEQTQLNPEMGHAQTTCEESLGNEKILQEIQSSTLIIREALSSLAKKEDIENLQDVLKRLSSANQESVKIVLDTIKEKGTVQSSLPVIVPNENPFTQLMNKNNLIISAIILIVGFVLGALIF